MSDNRKILVAKRGPDRHRSRRCPSPTENNRKGIKRTTDTPRKNLANDRLKRLRTSLNEEAQRQSENRKRPFDHNDVIDNKIPKITSQGCSASPNIKTDSEMERMDWTNTPSSSTTNDVSALKLDDLFVVVDTNIFLSNLQTIREIVNAPADKQAVIYIPWIVLEELDFIKEDCKKTNLRVKAQECIKYIESNMSLKNGRVLGQSLDEVNNQKNTGKSPDNKILSSCLQLLEQNRNIVLLTNDVNLRNKAHFNQIPVCDHSQILAKLSNVPKAQKILKKMTELCQLVIKECSRSAYGVAADKMPICQTNLGTLQHCIDVFSKYWFPVFQEFLMKQFKKVIEDLANFLKQNQNVSDGSNELNDLLRLCVRICIFFKDVECCRSTIEGTIRDLNNIKDS